MNSSTPKERRTNPRATVRLDVLWSTDALAVGDGPAEAVVTDLSHGGARLLCSRYLPEFSRVSLTFQTGERSFTCQGLVAWCANMGERSPNSFIAGIELQGADASLWARLDRIIDKST